MTALGFFISGVAWWHGLGWTLVWLLCGGGVLLSCISISGTWLVTLATVVAYLLTPGAFPGVGCILVFLILSVVVELAEWFAGSWGVTRRGGSRAAGWAALFGGLAGMVAGALIPPPILGSLFGMAAGSFAAAFVVEHRRLRHSGQAAHIAWGAVLARVLVIFLKVATTLAMTVTLAIGLLAN